MNIRLQLLLAFCGLLVVHPTVGAQCTGETEDSRQGVYTFATGAEAGAWRPAGVPVVTADQVRLLTNASDAAICQQLFDVILPLWRNPEEAKAGWHWAYYRVGDLYYVFVHRTMEPFPRNPDGTFNVSLGWTPLFLLDRNYQLVATIAS
jgi:hypothetical protein